MTVVEVKSLYTRIHQVEAEQLAEAAVNSLYALEQSAAR